MLKKYKIRRGKESNWKKVGRTRSHVNVLDQMKKIDR